MVFASYLKIQKQIKCRSVAIDNELTDFTPQGFDRVQEITENESSIVGKLYFNPIVVRGISKIKVLATDEAAFAWLTFLFAAT